MDLISPQLALFPADMLLLSGDAIVNESMLTGESVPVSKVPIRDDLLQRWKEGKDIDPEIAKSFLYSATKVIRVRGDTPAGGATQALGLVVRTGFNTTKGSLVRSMIFPKPMGFKFYRDSIRFIGFLAGLAGLGFLISAFKFIELGVSGSRGSIATKRSDLLLSLGPLEDHLSPSPRLDHCRGATSTSSHPLNRNKLRHRQTPQVIHLLHFAKPH